MGFRGGLRPLVTTLVLLCLCASCLCSLSDAKRTPPRPTTPTAKKPPPASSSQQSPAAAAYPALPVRAVCLGGWLVTEGWILPSLFDGIPNKDLLVRTVSVRSCVPAFLSPSLCLLTCAFRFAGRLGHPIQNVQDGTQLQFKSALRKTYLTADQGGGGAVVANKTQASDWETFKVRSVRRRRCRHLNSHCAAVNVN